MQKNCAAGREIFEILEKWDLFRDREWRQEGRTDLQYWCCLLGSPTNLVFHGLTILAICSSIKMLICFQSL